MTDFGNFSIVLKCDKVMDKIDIARDAMATVEEAFKNKLSKREKNNAIIFVRS